MIQLFMSAQIAKRGCLALRSAGREQTCFRSPLAGREVPGGCNGGSVGPCSLKPLRLMPRARYASRGNGRVRTEQTPPLGTGGGAEKG